MAGDCLLRVAALRSELPLSPATPDSALYTPVVGTYGCMDVTPSSPYQCNAMALDMDNQINEV